MKKKFPLTCSSEASEAGAFGVPIEEVGVAIEDLFAEDVGTGIFKIVSFEALSDISKLEKSAKSPLKDQLSL